MADKCAVCGAKVSRKWLKCVVCGNTLCTECALKCSNCKKFYCLDSEDCGEEKIDEMSASHCANCR